MSEAWDRLVERRCPAGQVVDERAFRLTPTDAMGGDLRSGLYAGVVTWHLQAQVPRYICAWVLRGSGRFRDAHGIDHPFAPGDCFQRFPDTGHEIRFDEPDAGAYWFAGLPPAFIEALGLCGFGDPQQPVFRAGQDQRLLRRALAYHERLMAAPDMALAPLMAEAFAIVCALHQAGRETRLAEQAPWLERAQELLRAGELDLPAVARACSMGSSTFRARFQEETGLSPSHWRIRWRIRRARQLLLGNVSIAEIAEQLGYPSVPSFTRQFRQWAGMPPAAWRRCQEANRD